MKMRRSVLYTALVLIGLAPHANAASAAVIGVSPADPLEQQAIANSTAAFTITNDYQASLIRFDQSGGNAVCNHVSHGVDAATSVPLNVEWEDGRATLKPGDCVRVDSSSARIAPAASLPSYAVLQGDVRK
jgi:hypothetical protein